MEPRRPKWSPGGPNGAQEAHMEPRRPKWSPGGPNGAQSQKAANPMLCYSSNDYGAGDMSLNHAGGSNGAQEAQMEPRRPKWSPRGPNGAQEIQMEPRRLKWNPGGLMEPRRPKWSPGG